jgi:cell wall-associated NlpC family hydrolase
MTNRRLALAAVFAGFSILFLSLLVVPLFFGAGQFYFGGGTGSGTSCTDTSQASAQPAESSDANSIPANYLAIYKRAGQDYGIPWNVLAGIGEVETDHGRSTEPGTLSGTNYAGAGGPMQFLASTFAIYGVVGYDGKKNLYDPQSAIPSTANMLKKNGAPDRMQTAIFDYNHSWDYVSSVLSWAQRYAAGNFNVVQANGPVCSDKQLASRVPNADIGKVITFALAQEGKPYIWGATGPDAFDCSGLVQAAYRAIGIDIPRTTFDQWPFGQQVPKGQEQPGDLVFFNSGPGSTPTSPGHVGMVIGDGKMIVARCSACVPAIGVFSYTGRGDLVGFTRPLASPHLKT